MTIILPRDAGRARKKERVMRAARVPRGLRRQYEDALTDQVRFLKAQTANISDLLRSGASRREVASILAQSSAAAQARLESVAPQIARNFADSVSAENKKAIEASIARAFSVDFASIIDGPEIAGELDLAIFENINLIKSIGQEHYERLGVAVMDNYRGVDQPGGVSLMKRIQDLGGITERRAKFIARDQTGKLIGDLNQIRQTANGIEEYIWRNAGDRRVVGNPSGLYPKGSRGHEDHWKREGEKFRWDKPPADGHPGAAYNCRCTSHPVADLEKLKAQFI